VHSFGVDAVIKIGPTSRSFAADAHGCIMVGTRNDPTEYKVVARMSRSARSGTLPSARLQ